MTMYLQLSTTYLQLTNAHQQALQKETKDLNNVHARIYAAPVCQQRNALLTLQEKRNDNMQ